MKKLGKILAASVLAAAVCFPAFGCASTQYVYGEYSYPYFNYGTTYGVKVLVQFKGDRIRHIDLVDAGDWVQTSSSWAYTQYGMTESGQNYFGNLRSVLDSFNAYSLDAIMSWKVLTVAEDETEGADPSPKGAIVTSAQLADGQRQFENVPAAITQPMNFGTQTGATQSLGRIILAVQDAISKKK